MGQAFMLYTEVLQLILLSIDVTEWKSGIMLWYSSSLRVYCFILHPI